MMQKKAELKACLEIVPKDDEAVNVESLAIKYPIVDWKTHILAKDKMCYEIIRADGSAKYYKIFSAMLDDFDRRYVLDLYRLVKERFKTTSPKGYDRLLWGDLITLFEPRRIVGIKRHLGAVQVTAGSYEVSTVVYVYTAGERILKRSRIPLVKVRWNSKRGPEFTWEREDQFKKKYPHLFTKTAPS
ncbi:hypothetical protein Tco_0808147, partial [Tanacetum coccineum]